MTMAFDHLNGPDVKRTRSCSFPSCDEVISWGQTECQAHDHTRIKRAKLLAATSATDDEWLALAERVKAMRQANGQQCAACGGDARILLNALPLCSTCWQVRA